MRPDYKNWMPKGMVYSFLFAALGCGVAAAEKLFLTFFAVAHGLASLLCNNAMAYDEAECQTMLETVFYGALASLKGDTNA